MSSTKGTYDKGENGFCFEEAISEVGFNVRVIRAGFLMSVSKSSFGVKRAFDFDDPNPIVSEKDLNIRSFVGSIWEVVFFLTGVVQVL